MKSNTDLGLRYVVAQSPAISLFATGLTKGEKQFDPDQVDALFERMHSIHWKKWKACLQDYNNRFVKGALEDN